MTGRQWGGVDRRQRGVEQRGSMLLASVNQRCYCAEMSHRRAALGSVHHHRRSPRHVQPAVRGSSASAARRHTPTEEPGFGAFFQQPRNLPGRRRREGDCDWRRAREPPGCKSSWPPGWGMWLLDCTATQRPLVVWVCYGQIQRLLSKGRKKRSQISFIRCWPPPIT